MAATLALPVEHVGSMTAPENVIVPPSACASGAPNANATTQAKQVLRIQPFIYAPSRTPCGKRGYLSRSIGVDFEALMPETHAEFHSVN